MKLNLFLLLLLVSSTFGFAQSYSTLSSYFDDADYDISQEEYSIALPKFMRIYRVDTNNANINYEIGLCLLNIMDQKNKAYTYLEKAVKSLTPSYQNGTYEERNAPYDALEKLGDAYAIIGEFEKAIASYYKFLSMINSGDESIAKINRKIASCTNAKTLVQNPVKVEWEHIPQLSSVVSDYNPVFTKDEKTVYFTQQGLVGKRNDEKRLMLSTLSNGNWSEPVNVTEKLQSDYNLTTLYISPDGKRILCSNDDEGRIAIFELVQVKRVWSAPKKLSKKINMACQGYASLTDDGKTIYFTSNKKGGLGGFDIYKSTCNKEGEWSDAVNLGPQINTPFDEYSPVFLAETSTLFFSSEGHTSMGKADIFYSKLENTGNWSTPVNLGYPINTPDDEEFYWPVGDGFSGYIAKYDKNSEGEIDIYNIRFSPQSDVKLVSDNSQNKQDTKNADSTSVTTDKKDTANVASAKSDTISKMTILIKVTKNPLESAYLKDIDGVKACMDKEGNYRYYYGEYNSYTEASRDFDKILKLGFYSAVLKNAKEDSLYYAATADFNFASDTADVVQNYNYDDPDGNKTDQNSNKQNGNNQNHQNKTDVKTDKTNNDTNNNKSDNKTDKSNNANNNKSDKTNNTDNKSDKVNKTDNQTDKNNKTDNKTTDTKNQNKTDNTGDSKNQNSGTNNNGKVSDTQKHDNVLANKSDKNGSTVDTSKTNTTSKNGNNQVENGLKNEKQSSSTTQDGSKYPGEMYLTEINDKIINSQGDLYLIQVSTVKNTAPDIFFFRNMPYVTELVCKDGWVRYTTGVFENAKDARAELEKVKAYFPDAYIVNAKNFKEKLLIADLPKVVNTYNMNYKKATEENTTTIADNKTSEKVQLYSIQIASSIKSAAEGYFKDIADVKEKMTANGYYKYYFGKFEGYAAAKAELQNVRGKGFKDAFIIRYTDDNDAKNVETKAENTTKEQSVESSVKLTIQVASAKKQSPLAYFKGLDPIKEITAKQGWFIYIYGEFNSLNEAKEGLKTVKAAGFADAFINKLEKYQ